MNYGEAFIKGSSKKGDNFYNLHMPPQMANNELSGPLVNTNLFNMIKDISKKKKLQFSYRFLFLPETIGTIALLNERLSYFKKNALAVYVITCVGTEKKFKLIQSPYNDTVSEKIAIQALKNYSPWDKKSFLERGSDERQWLAPKVSIDCCSIVTSKYGEYKEYHTSKDDLNFISLNGIKEVQNYFLKFFKFLKILNFIII